MKVILARNVHQALPEACHQLLACGVRRESRNGPVLRFPGMLATEYLRPLERVVFWQDRDANPFFHFFEALWMLAGRNDVAFPSLFNSSFGQYSDDGSTYNGAYGFRWRRHFGYDQLRLIADALRANPDCRRQTLSMWDPKLDLGLQSKDLPCNTHAYFQRNHEGRLEMSVLNRSNDLVWGAYGANAVHFGFLLEYMAALVGCDAGRYWQVSMNTHVYLDPHEELIKKLAEKAADPFAGNPAKWAVECPYEQGAVMPFPLVNLKFNQWQRELETFLQQPSQEWRDPFFAHVALPLFNAWSAFKTDSTSRFKVAIAHVNQCAAPDWQMACTEWLQRREEKWNNRKKTA